MVKVKNEEELIKYGVKLGRAIKNGGSDIELLPGDAEPGDDEVDDERSFVNGGIQNNDTAMTIELIGDVGAGKTTLTRGIAQGLGVAEEVTSPSFTVSKRYAFPGGALVHYDFYRLPDPGLMREELAEALADPQNVVVIEWGESVADLLPEKHVRININLLDEGGRELSVVRA